MGLGSNQDGSWSFLDLISIISFCIALENLDMNITQEDMQKSEEKLDKALRYNVEEIHEHLEIQDEKINKILEVLQNGTERDLQQDK